MANQVSIDQLAEALNLKRRRTQQLVQAGIIPPAEKGRYDLIACLKKYVTYLQGVVRRRESLRGADELREQRARLVEARASDAELDLMERCGELVPVEALTRAMSGTILSVRQQLLNLPGRVAQQLVGESANSIRQRLRVEVHALLIQLTMPAAYHDPGACDVCGGPKPPLEIDPGCAKTVTNPLVTPHVPGTNGHGRNGTGR